MTKTKKFYSVAEVVDIIGNISKGNVYRLIKRGEIPAMYIGQRPFVPCSWVAAKLAEAETWQQKDAAASKA